MGDAYYELGSLEFVSANVQCFLRLFFRVLRLRLVIRVQVIDSLLVIVDVQHMFKPSTTI